MLELVLYLYQVGSKIQIQAIRHGSEHHYALAILLLVQCCVLGDTQCAGGRGQWQNICYHE